MIGKMRGLKRKLAACADEEERLYKQVDARARHLRELGSMQTVDDVKYQEWSRRRLDRLLVDYLLRHGYSQSAKEMADKKNMRELVDIETFESMNKIHKSLEDGSVAEALAWCNENKKELRKMDSNLEFMLRYQQYIELVRSQQTPKLVEAISHAKKHLIPHRDAYPHEVNRAAGLLAFPPDRVAAALSSFSSSSSSSHSSSSVSCREYEKLGNLYSPSRWGTLASLFVEAHNNLLGLPSSPLLHIALSSGLSALKTPACHSSSGSSSSSKNGSSGEEKTTSHGGSSVCPVCSTELNELARAVPYAHHSKSHVEHDLMLLPNGRVYGRERLVEYAAKSGLPASVVKDLVTGDMYPQELLKKV
ncbi:CTLH/CRA C-terminal to lish motif domain-containing protein, partial [Coniochaeta sp. 2T2.1]